MYKKCYIADAVASFVFGTPSLSLCLSPSIFIIAAIITFVILASASIYLLLHCLSRRSHSHPSSSYYSSRVAHRISSSSSSGSGDSVAANSNREKEAAVAALISLLPLFTLGSSLAASPKLSPDCAVCLSPFHPDAQLRFLLAYCHAFHSHCINPWVLSSPSYHLCRSPIALPSTNNNPNNPNAVTSFDAEASLGFLMKRDTEVKLLRRRPSVADISGLDAPATLAATSVAAAAIATLSFANPEQL